MERELTIKYQTYKFETRFDKWNNTNFDFWDTTIDSSKGSST